MLEGKKLKLLLGLVLLTAMAFTMGGCRTGLQATQSPSASGNPVVQATTVSITTATIAAPEPGETTGPVEAPATTTDEPSSTEITLTDGLGKEIALSQPAERVISLAPALTEIMFAINAGEKVVGRDSYSDYPAGVKSLPDIGGGFSDLNVEAILAQKPDLVLASSLTGPEQIQVLESAGLTVFAVQNPKDFDGMYANLITVAQLVGRERQAELLIESLRQRVAAVESRVANITSHPLVFYELDGTDPNAIWTPGPGSYIDTLITMAGGENLGSSLESEWAQVSPEVILTRDPDIILLGDATWGNVTVEQAAARTGWEALTAVKEGQLFPFDDNIVSRPGPRLVDGLEKLAELLHPEIFQ